MAAKISDVLRKEGHPGYAIDVAALETLVVKLCSRVEGLEAWQLAIAEGTGFVNRAEGQSGYEVADPQAILNHVKRLESRVADLESSSKAALKTWGTKLNVEIRQMFGNATPEELLSARDRFTQAMTALEEVMK